MHHSASLSTLVIDFEKRRCVVGELSLLGDVLTNVIPQNRIDDDDEDDEDDDDDDDEDEVMIMMMMMMMMVVVVMMICACFVLDPDLWWHTKHAVLLHRVMNASFGLWLFIFFYLDR